jgi:tetratricopeptide (TPR) repeat protein
MTRAPTLGIRHPVPAQTFLLMLLGGPWAALPYLGGHVSRGFRAAMIMASLAPPAAVVLLPYNWLLIGLVLAAWNFSWTLGVLLTHPLERPAPSTLPMPRRLKRALAVAVAGSPMAILLASLEQWISDLLWSSFYPINSSLDSISSELGTVWLGLFLLLFFSALHASRQGGDWTPRSLAGLLGLVAVAHVIAGQAHLLLVTIPLWQVQDLSIFPAWMDNLRHVLFFALWFVAVPPLVHAAFRGRREGTAWVAGFSRGLGSLLLSMAGLALVTGLPINYALIVGREYEKSGTPEAAIPWYSKALAWSKSDPLKSYLQFRVALLHRKSGNLDEAREAFIRVLVKYHHDGRLLLEASEYKDRLEKRGDSSLPRVVIPGMEARTEYKSAYCVPNSLGLILNFWGDRTGAKRIGAEITQLERGSLITDQAYFAESRGFANLVLPLRSLEDIFKLIDRGIPVLAYIPGHVIAVFGYDRALQTLVTYDVNTYDIWDDQRWSEFSQDWSHLYNTLGVVVPKERLPELEEILGGGVYEANEAYLQFLLAKLQGDDAGAAARHLERAAGKGFFFADWDYQLLMGKAPDKAPPDSVVASFMLGHEVYESQILEYLRSLYQRGDYRRSIAFIERYRQENRLSSGMATLLAGCYHRIGDSAMAGEVLLSYLDLDDQEPVTLEFLLGRDYVREDPETARRISLKLLGSEEKVAGSAAALAFRTWRSNTVVDFRNIDEALALMENYIDNRNPYDRAAIRELVQAFGLKQFRPDDEFNRQSWEKKIRLLKSRLESGP